MASFGEDNRAATQREEGSSQNKYGGISPKKPLINKDHERAYFDSADWALGKQGASNSTKGTTEPLKPKLQRTAYPQLPPRRPACTSGATE
ncbi:unknown protein [Oryza sativa Japonica Group]|uniref:Os01g0305200 protein n=2 Tax=Oryza sativa subsp. japonica TaxID=39947 RepID=Q657U9_ORYSJ|nr:uncharacterized protein LOC4323909 [Oryza sativa Japonica Group]XP_052145198.1 uncharacterized protein LOC127764359 [Oryza glaberrima]KAB8081127.1 hypothetical protein EE612_002027 [Oryza sativa]KAF2949809.1 hypothetical protein DAI22_01g139900 [Oryza sativa Japonica Group]BAD44911.1 unknown protein [Oryza sativa Japonica Group]BAD44921.1 unknown protein [Oryza sativa Japonica Group]BAF04755.2 Os01g0305200 [Oryza sativa Japonica Group]|eukprot:NP_001042841.2 Os01g0305200 [Oryza sativa Japonica Group]